MASGPSSSFTAPSGLHIISPSSPAVPASAVPAPLRLIFPHVPTFSTPHIPPNPNVDVKAHPPPRERAYLGIHPLLPKAVLPTVGMWFAEDWDDLADMHLPFLLERVVIADRGAAERGRENWRSSQSSDNNKRSPSEEGEPVWAAPFVGLNAPDGWWGSVRSALLRYLHVSDGLSGSGSAAGEGHGLGSLWGKRKETPKPVVSYISMQEQPMRAGPRLSGDDHEKLVNGLMKLEREGVLGEVHVVNGNGSVPAAEWAERMAAIARSTVRLPARVPCTLADFGHFEQIVMGPFGHHLSDAIFMGSPATERAHATPSSESEQKGEEASRSLPPILMEFFPPGTFVRDQQFAMHVLGIEYIAWWNGMCVFFPFVYCVLVTDDIVCRRFSGDNLPSVVTQISPSYETQTPIDVEAVLRAVREEASRRVA